MAVIISITEGRRPDFLPEKPGTLFDSQPSNDDYWNQIWNRATAAAKQVSSIVAKTESAEPDVDIGTAWVQLPDGRSSFARWMRRTDKDGCYLERPGYRIEPIVPEESINVKRAYAEAFAQVLRGAGIHCDVGSRLSAARPKRVEPGQEDPRHATDPQLAFFPPRITLLRQALDCWFAENGLGADFGWYLPRSEEFHKLRIKWFEHADLVLLFDGTGLFEILNYHTSKQLESEFNAIVAEHGYYFELGHAWNLGFYNH